MKIPRSKVGFIIDIIFAILIAILVVMFPFSMGFSWIVVGELSQPWNGFISKVFDLHYGEMAMAAVAPGIFMNMIILYIMGYGLEKLGRGLTKQK